MTAAEAPPEPCHRCVGTPGWVDAGVDDHQRWYVRKCPSGCVPLTPNEQRAVDRRAARVAARQQAAGQTSFAASEAREALAAAIRGEVPVVRTPTVHPYDSEF